MTESRQSEVCLHDIQAAAVEQLVQFAYTAEINIGEKNVQVNSSVTIIQVVSSDRGRYHKAHCNFYNQLQVNGQRTKPYSQSNLQWVIHHELSYKS